MHVKKIITKVVHWALTPSGSPLSWGEKSSLLPCEGEAGRGLVAS